MRQLQRRATWTGAILGTLAALFVLGLQAHASEQGPETEEFHQTYSLVANGRVELENINGAVHISAWDRTEVKVDAVKRAWSKQRLEEAKIRINASENSISIRTVYPERNHTSWGNGHENQPASVEYTVTIPRNARLDGASIVNGSLDLDGLSGEIKASCVNGTLAAHNLGGRAELSTVNGKLEANLDRLESPVDVSSVNAAVLLTLPSDAKAELEATTVKGAISDDFGLPVTKRRFIGRDLRGELGCGPHVRVSNVNGRIEIRHADDNRPQSPSKDLHHDHAEKGDDNTI